MNFVTTVFPIFENNICGKFEYGFVTGKKNKDTGFFENSSIITRTFSKKQKFTYMQPIEVVVGAKDNDENYCQKKETGKKHSMSIGLDVNDVEIPTDDDFNN